jgi:hypothetical protein
MHIETRFGINDNVRVVKDGGFVGTVIGVHVQVGKAETAIAYDVTLPLDRQGHGRNKTAYWRYREDWLEPMVREATTSN